MPPGSFGKFCSCLFFGDFLHFAILDFFFVLKQFIPMQRLTSFFVFVFLTGTLSTGVFLAADEPKYAITADEKAALLDKAAAALSWFQQYELTARAKIASFDYRKRISPLELMQAAELMKKAGKKDMSRNLREMFPYLRATSFECFEIAERLGEETLTSFQEEKELLSGGNTLDSTAVIKQEAEKFIKNELNPAEKMALMHAPETAGEIMRAVDVLAAAGRPAVTRYELRRFMNVEAAPEEYAKIVKRIGSKRLMQIAGDKRFAPVASVVVAKILSEAKKHWEDNGLIQEAAEALGNDAVKDNIHNSKGVLTEETKEDFTVLWQGGQVSVQELITRLAETKDKKARDALLAALLSLGSDAKEILAESLNSNSPTLVENAVIGLAAVIRAEESFLLYSAAFSISEDISDELKQKTKDIIESKSRNKISFEDAVRTLYRRAVDYTEHNRPLKSDENNMVHFWNWDEKEQKVVFVSMSIPDAYRELAYRYARQAVSLIPDDDSNEYTVVEQFYLLTKFERDAYQNGLDEPLPPEISPTNMKPEELETLLKKSLEKNFAGAALIILAALKQQAEDGKVSAKDLLVPTAGKERTLIHALVSPYRRVRFAALETIMTLNPDFPYPGSSYVSDALTWFARGEGKKVVISAAPKYSEAAKTAGYFIALGYQPELAVTGKDAMKAAVDSPDVVLVIADMKTTQPTVPNLVQELRKDRRTMEIPVAVLSSDEKELNDSLKYETFITLPEMQKIDRMSPDNPFAVSLSVMYPVIIDDQQAEKTEKDLMHKTGTTIVPPKIRIEQAKKSLHWLKIIVENAAEKSPAIYRIENYDEILRRALNSDVLLEEALELAAVTKSAAAQDIIYGIISEEMFSMPVREKAADAFKKNIEKFGILLRGKQVERLYDRYNASEFESKETQVLLGKVIDWVEDVILK